MLLYPVRVIRSHPSEEVSEDAVAPGMRYDHDLHNNSQTSDGLYSWHRIEKRVLGNHQDLWQITACGL